MGFRNRAFPYSCDTETVPGNDTYGRHRKIRWSGAASGGYYYRRKPVPRYERGREKGRAGRSQERPFPGTDQDYKGDEAET